MPSNITVTELLEMARASATPLVEIAEWWKVGRNGARRMYIRKAGKNDLATEIHFSGFSLDRPEVKQVHEREAQHAHLGRVRGIIAPSLFRSEARKVLLEIIKEALDIVQDGPLGANDRGPADAGDAEVLQRWARMPVERLVSFRRHLAAARAAAHADSEGLAPLAIALEEIGAACLGKGVSLRRYREPIRKCLGLKHEIARKYTELFDSVTQGRNAGMHEGAWVRHVAMNGVELAIIIEDALAETIMERQKRSGDIGPAVWRVEHFMVSEPVCARRWHTISHVRRVMLSHSFSFLPMWMSETSSWGLLWDHALAEWLGVHGQERCQKQQLSLDEAISASPGLVVEYTATPLFLDADRDSALVATKRGPGLVVDRSHPDRLLGIVTAFDLL